MIRVSLLFWNEVVCNHSSLVSEDIQAFLKETLCNDAICTFVGHRTWTVHLPPKHETLFRIKYSDYIL